MIQKIRILTGHWLLRGALIKSLSQFPSLKTARKRAAVFVALFGLAGCTELVDALPPLTLPQPNQPKPFMSIFPTAYKELPGWIGDDHSEALPAFIRSCEKIEKLPEDKAIGSFEEMGKVSDWLPLCQAARVIRPGNKIEAQYFFESRFLPYTVRNNNEGKGLFTGYYEPDLRGAFGPDPRYRYPIFARPDDLIGANLEEFDDKYKGQTIAGRLKDGRFVPYYSRAEIEDGALAGRQLETVWVDSAIDAFILHIQGSGRIILPDGSHVRVGYAGRNGHRYTSIGRELVAAGVMRLDDVTMPAIRAWMEAHPVAALALMRKNNSFIFFKVAKDNAGPIGAQGVVLTPGRSLAVDRKFWSLGLPVWLDSTEPGTAPKQKLRRLLITQDTGSAIKGPVRGDYFWGHGANAALKAGLMKEQGEIYMLLPQSAAREYPKSGS